MNNHSKLNKLGLYFGFLDKNKVSILFLQKNNVKNSIIMVFFLDWFLQFLFYSDSITSIKY